MLFKNFKKLPISYFFEGSIISEKIMSFKADFFCIIIAKSMWIVSISKVFLSIDIFEIFFNFCSPKLKKLSLKIKRYPKSSCSAAY